MYAAIAHHLLDLALPLPSYAAVYRCYRSSSSVKTLSSDQNGMLRAFHRANGLHIYMVVLAVCDQQSTMLQSKYGRDGQVMLRIRQSHKVDSVCIICSLTLKEHPQM